ncbi:MAG: Mu transposase C-terminal domain-containing protein [Magnetococcus sp. YQC-5]
MRSPSPSEEMSRVWLTTGEIAECLSITRQAVDLRIQEQCWRRPEWEGKYWRRREGMGGGCEYHRMLLPQGRRDDFQVTPDVDLERQQAVVKPLTKNETKRLDTRLFVLDLLDDFIETLKLKQVDGEVNFVKLYNANNTGRLDIPADIRATLPTLSLATLRRWRREKRDLGIAAMVGRYGPRRGADIWNCCEPLRTLVIGLITTLPHAGGKLAYELALARMGEQVESINPKDGSKVMRPLPSMREFQRFIQRFKKENAALFAMATNPDKFKGSFRMAAGRMYDGIVRRNQLWEFDASPADCLCLDGRYSLYVMIDIFSRWIKVRVTKTPKSAAALLLMRDCILDWGVPEELKTDNGSDFTSRHFTDVVRRMGIKQSLYNAGKPEEKAGIERVIGTIQHSFMEMQPGYIGHSVADRKQIEARKAFLDRLGVSDDKMFCVEMTHDVLQTKINEWIEKKYIFEPHAGLGGKTPFDVRTAFRGAITRIEGEGVLDHLLLPPPDGKETRTITSKGIRVNGIDYNHGAMSLIVGQDVHVRLDPDDLGRIYVYRGDPWEFVSPSIQSVLGSLAPRWRPRSRPNRKKCWMRPCKRSKKPRSRSTSRP